MVDFDIAIPDLNAIEVARRLTLAGPRMEPLVLTLHDSRLRCAALATAALGYVLKARMPVELHR